MYTLSPQTWAAWQMLPGYGGESFVPYFSPIWVRTVQPLKTGKSRLRLEFDNLFYAQGVQDFGMEIRVLKRADSYLVAEIIDGLGASTDRVAILGDIGFEWLKQFCPYLWRKQPPDSCSPQARASVDAYLREVFGDRRDTGRDLARGHG